MPSYDLRKLEDRGRLLQDRRAELDAVSKGTWPRDLNDLMRWTRRPAPGQTAPEYAGEMCRAEIDAVSKMGHPAPIFKEQ